MSIVLLSTFGIKCGIAGYTESFAAALKALGHRVHVLASETPTEYPAVPDGWDDTFQVAWYFDNANYISSSMDPDKIIAAVREVSPAGSVLHIQYHLAFFSVDKLLELIKKAHSTYKVAVTLHNSRILSANELELLRETGALVFVHTAEETASISASGVKVRCIPIPIPALDKDDSSRTGEGPEEREEIGTFGFLRPHKGLSNLILAMSDVLKVFPNVRLNAYCALYPSTDSECEAKHCAGQIRALGLTNSVNLDTTFHKTADIQAKLARHYLNILPYGPSSEGGSAAANFCLGARVPLITSRSDIFAGVRKSVYQVENTSPKTLALSIMTFLANRGLHEHYQCAASREADALGWNTVAAKYLGEYEDHG